MKKNILLIDDDDSIAEVVRMFLEEEGYSVKTYPDGTKLEIKVKEANPDIMIIDYLLPEINGVEVAKLLRDKHLGKDFPIIMIAANQMYKDRAIASGINAFLEKPFDLYELLNLINRHIH